MRWSVERRLEFIEFRLFWEGVINRADIIRKFAISVPQASKDLALYDETAPGNLLYDKSARCYRASDTFKPVCLEPNSAHYLEQLGAANGSASADSWVATTLECDAIPIPCRRIVPQVLRAVLKAMREGLSLEILYQSMNPRRPHPAWRRITPHAFGSDGLRWHSRAFCHVDMRFKDFLLSRIMETRDPGQPGATSSDDALWHEHFPVLLSPNPDLSADQQAVIASDYDMINGCAQVPVRKALLYHFERRLRLDSLTGMDAPHEVPVVVANRTDFDAACAEAIS